MKHLIRSFELKRGGRNVTKLYGGTILYCDLVFNVKLEYVMNVTLCNVT
jgi:hypothetical protein